MIGSFIIILVAMFVAGLIERLFPDQRLTVKPGWLLRACTMNLLQFTIVLLGHFTWEHWIVDDNSLFKLKDTFSPFIGGLIAYVANAWLFYFWHLLRHTNRLCWLLFHQFHHSPERIEVITSFYKHPFEIAINSVLITFLMYSILGVSVEQNAYMTLISALAEFFYHANIRTPHWIGFILQRPESHRLHHIRDKRYCANYGDLPIFDILNGTFCNPTDKDMNFQTGFSENKEEKLKELIMCKDVLEKPVSNKHVLKKIIFCILVIIGCLNTFGYVNNMPKVRGVAFMTVASPLPLVFSVYNGIETFSTMFDLDITFQNDTQIQKTIDHKLYGNMKGPYNRKNVYGVVFSHGPFFKEPNQIKMRDQILQYGLCKPGELAKEFGIYDKLKHVTINVKSKTVGNEGKSWRIDVPCQP